MTSDSLTSFIFSPPHTKTVSLPPTNLVLDSFFAVSRHVRWACTRRRYMARGTLEAGNGTPTRGRTLSGALP